MSSAKLACALPWRSWFGEANPARSAMFLILYVAINCHQPQGFKDFKD